MVQASLLEGLDGAIINVGSGQETSIRDLAALVARVTGQEVEQVILMDGGGGVYRLVSSTETMRRRLGVIPRFDLRSGLEQMLALDPRFSELKQKNN